jgi:hypothetical protein
MLAVGQSVPPMVTSKCTTLRHKTLHFRFSEKRCKQETELMANMLKDNMITTVIELSKKGWSQRRIAKELGNSP